LVLRQEHRAGEKLFVDYAGQMVPVTDPKTGVVTEASIFVAVLGASNYTFAEASWKQDLACWIGSHIRALEFLGGCPALLIPDNLKTGVLRPCRYEPDLNPTYQEMAAHYGMAVIPARVRKPGDKSESRSRSAFSRALDTGRSAQTRLLQPRRFRSRRRPRRRQPRQTPGPDRTHRRVIVDDWAMAPLADTERRDFLEIWDDRYATRSTILTSQIPLARWHDQIAIPLLPTASSTPSFTMHTASNSKEPRSGKPNPSNRRTRIWNRLQGAKSRQPDVRPHFRSLFIGDPDAKLSGERLSDRLWKLPHYGNPLNDTRIPTVAWISRATSLLGFIHSYHRRGGGYKNNLLLREKRSRLSPVRVGPQFEFCIESSHNRDLEERR